MSSTVTEPLVPMEADDVGIDQVWPDSVAFDQVGFSPSPIKKWRSETMCVPTSLGETRLTISVYDGPNQVDLGIPIPEWYQEEDTAYSKPWQIYAFLGERGDHTNANAEGLARLLSLFFRSTPGEIRLMAVKRASDQLGGIGGSRRGTGLVVSGEATQSTPKQQIPTFQRALALQLSQFVTDETPPLPIRDILTQMPAIMVRSQSALGTVHIALTMRKDKRGNTLPVEIFPILGYSGTDSSAFAESFGRIMSMILRSASDEKRINAIYHICEQLYGLGAGTPITDIADVNHILSRSVPDSIARVLMQFLPEDWQEKIIEDSWKKLNAFE